MTILRSKYLILLLFLVVGCSNKYVPSDIKVISTSSKRNDILYLDKDLNKLETSNYLATNNIYPKNNILKDNLMFSISNELKSTDLLMTNLDTGSSKKIDYANTMALVKDNLYYNSNLVGGLSVIKYDLKTKTKITKAIKGDAIFQMINYQDRLFIFVDDKIGDEKNAKSYLIELDLESLEEISRQEMLEYDIFNRPVIEDNTLYYIDSKTNDLVIQGLSSDTKKVIKLNTEHVASLKVYDNKVYVDSYKYNEKEEAISRYIQIDLSNDKVSNFLEDIEIIDFIKKGDFYYVLTQASIIKYDNQLTKISEYKRDDVDSYTNDAFLE